METPGPNPLANPRIPDFLIDRPAAVAKAWRPRAKPMLRGATWSEALDGVRWVPMEEVGRKGGQFLLERGSSGSPPCLMPVYVITTLFRELAYDVMSDREEVYQQLKRITLTAFEELWSTICMLSAMGYPKGTSYDIERPEFAARILQGHLRYWDWCCAHEEMFNSPLDGGLLNTPEHPWRRWSSWAWMPRGAAHEMKIVSEDRLDSQLSLSARELGHDLQEILGIYAKTHWESGE